MTALAGDVWIDGSHGEGGGQVLRTSVSLAALTGRAVEIVNVRAGRPKPGLQPQHLTAVRAAAALCDAELEGAAIGSTRFRFVPRCAPKPEPYRFDIATAGSASLVAQTVCIPLAHAAGPSHVTITGGTHVPFAPPADYLERVYFPTLRRAGLNVRYRIRGAGFYPRGGGEIEMEIDPIPALQPLTLVERGKLRSLRASIVTSSLPDHVAERGATAVRQFFKAVGRVVEIEHRDLPSPGAGAAVLVSAECEGGFAGFSGIGKRGRPMEEVAREPCEAFMAWWKAGAPCDEHLADQLVLPMALARGESAWTTPAVTEHLRTVLWVTKQFLPIETALEERPDGSGRVTLRAGG